MADLLFVGQFIASKAGKTGLTVTVDVDRYTLADGSRTALVTAGSATEGRRGLYHYRLASADLATYQYVATFITADATVDQQEIAALGIVVPDALVGSRLASASYSAPPSASDNATAVWAYTPRTLTQTAAAVASVMAGTSLTITRGDTLSATLTGLGNITGYANLWFTVKWATSDLDAAAIIQIDTDTGLLTVNGAAATAGNGSITVDDATAGDITIALEASVTDDLTPATGLVYDVQWQSGTSIYTLTSGVAVVSADVTRAVA